MPPFSLLSICVSCKISFILPFDGHILSGSPASLSISLLLMDNFRQEVLQVFLFLCF